VSDEAQVIRFPVERRQPRRLVSLRELQELFGFSERWWRYRTAEESFPVHRWGGRLRFDPIEVEQWMEERYPRPTT
jgi:predicted DNA-binding transcriptional regulator AlpA